MIILRIFLLFLALPLLGIEEETLRKLLSTPAPFDYPLRTTLYPGKTRNEEVTLLLHGMGGNFSLASIIQSYGITKEHLVSFNFPQVNWQSFNPQDFFYGTIKEVLPPLFILKQLVIDGDLEKINLYGFSAGGGAVVNLISVLNSDAYDKPLLNIGIDQDGKKKILLAIQKGIVMLDAPLKSFDELFDAHDYSDLKSYSTTIIRPIDALKNFKGLNLNVILFFQTPDDILTNRDDALFIQRLKEYNKGKTMVIQKNEGGHAAFHRSLWEAFNTFK